MKPQCVTIQMKANSHNFDHVVLIILQFKQGDSNFTVSGWDPSVCLFNWKLSSNPFMWHEDYSYTMQS